MKIVRHENQLINYFLIPPNQIDTITSLLSCLNTNQVDKIVNSGRITKYNNIMSLLVIILRRDAQSK
jgi:hypothetical protein